MRVYVESNFLLELVLNQQQAWSCVRLLLAAESKVITLVVPAYALVESWDTVDRRKIKWKAWREQHSAQARELNRSPLTSPAGAGLKDADDDLLQVEQGLAERRKLIWERIYQHVELIPIDGRIVAEAARLNSDFGLRFPDAVMLSSVLARLNENPGESLFMNRDAKGFDDPSIAAELARRECKFFRDFDKGTSYISGGLGLAL